FISEETVKAHLKHIMEKLGANDRTQAVAIGVRRGIIQILTCWHPTSLCDPSEVLKGRRVRPITFFLLALARLNRHCRLLSIQKPERLERFSQATVYLVPVFFGEFLYRAWIESTRTSHRHFDAEFVALMLVDSSVHVWDETLAHPCVTHLENFKVHA